MGGTIISDSHHIFRTALHITLVGVWHINNSFLTALYYLHFIVKYFVIVLQLLN